MCGIVGFNWDDKALLKKMMSSVKHRGPDDSGYYIDKNISLGHQRLSIIDLSSKGRQPIFNENKTLAIIFNGEIYNYKILKNKLEEKGHKFYTGTDTEVIVHAYEEYGEECVNHLNGMFAFAIYNSNSKTLFIARDRLGIKPLYYTFIGKKFIFASEIKAILEHSIKREIDSEALAQFFTYGYTLSPKTLFKGIYKLPPASYMSYSKKGINIKNYWDLKFNLKNKSLGAWKRELFYNLKDAVDKRLMSDVPIGAYLSGGIDSSSIVAMMSLIMDQKVNTYSVGFDSAEVVNELNYAKLVAEKLNTNHHEIIVSSEDALKSLSKIVWHLDEPINNPAAVPLYYMSKAAKKDMTVVLNGNGGDEIFAGYRQHKVLSYLNKLNHLPMINSKFLSRSLKKSARLLSNKYSRYLEFGAKILPNIKNPALSYSILMYQNYTPKDLQKLLQMNYSPVPSIVPFFNPKKDILNNVTLIDLKRMLPENYLMVDDKINMANGIESRVPFLDYELVEFVASMPANLKLNGLNEKYILKQTMAKILPKEIIQRKKYGFTPPVAHWIDNDLLDYARNKLSSSEIKHLFNKYYLTKILEGNKKDYNKIFPLLMTSLWSEQYL